jgi:hypothetical protein
MLDHKESSSNPTAKSYEVGCGCDVRTRSAAFVPTIPTEDVNNVNV